MQANNRTGKHIQGLVKQVNLNSLFYLEIYSSYGRVHLNHGGHYVSISVLFKLREKLNLDQPHLEGTSSNQNQKKHPNNLRASGDPNGDGVIADEWRRA